MSRTKVKINKVSNLTDARYFAAMGVDYLGFCCNLGTEMYCAPSKIKEIIEWVSGPEFVLEFDGWQSAEDITGLIGLGMAQAVHFGAFATYTESFAIPVFKDFILENVDDIHFGNIDFPVIRTDKNYSELTPEEISNLQRIINSNKVFLDINFENHFLEEMLQILPVYGLIIRGGEEEKVGLKSFEQLDSVFEILDK